MKKIIFSLTYLVLLCILLSCEAFSKPLYSFSRDISGVIGSMSTEELAGNIDKLSSDPEKAADIINELSGRDQGDVKNLPQKDKEKLLDAGVGAILPTSKIGETVEQLTAEGEKDYKKIMETLSNDSPDINTKAMETVLQDKDVLATTDASTLALGAASLIVNTVNQEGGEESMEKFQAAATAASEGGTFNEESFKQSLSGSGFSEESISALTTAMGVTSVLTGTAGDGQPNRKEDLGAIGFGGMNMGDFLDQMTGVKK
jgi:hypothetical protein